MHDGPASDSHTDPQVEYPRALAEQEQQLLAIRRAAVNAEPPAAKNKSALGIGLSGGGIRSATFALGFFQALAHARRLQRIDYLSTVSGGGYFGGFYGALFRRKAVRGHDDVQALLRGEQNPELLRYMRENGRYLAPAGTDDLLIGAATLFRNWLTVQLLLLSVLFAAFLSCQMLTEALAPAGSALFEAGARLPLWTRLVDAGIPLSPWLTACAALIVFWVVPLTWSYWTIGRDVPHFLPGRSLVRALWTVLLFAVVACGGWLLAARWEQPELGMTLVGISGVALATGMIAMLLPATWAPRFAVVGAAVPILSTAWGVPSQYWVPPIGVVCFALFVIMLLSDKTRRRLVERASGPPLASGAPDLDQDNEGRYELSAALKTALVVTLAVFGFALLDTAARKAWVLVGTMRLVGPSAAVGSLLAVASTIVRQLWPLLAARPSKTTRLALPAALLARVCGIGLLLGLFFLLDVVALAVVLSAGISDASLVLGVTVALCLVLGSSRNLLNASTQLPLYSARLIRAYLGASNPNRTLHDSDPEQTARRSSARPSNDLVPEQAADPVVHTDRPSPAAASRVMPDDDMTAEDYWWWPGPARSRPNPYAKGAPLHLVNVTVNETVDGRSQIQQGDRNGLGLAIGPAGFTAGVRHHAVFGEDAQSETKRLDIYPDGAGWKVFRFGRSAPTTPGGGAAAMLRAVQPSRWFTRQHSRENFPIDQLSLGQWLGISGAAFSTGLGSRTNLGLSIIAALANVRLGFWWRPGTKTAISWPHRLGALFWVQTYLFRELLARFPGTSRELWYLSDGGHFENLGAYELIRRRVGCIVIVDAEADPDYRCESLAYLVRKARIDFGATITFVEDSASAASPPRFTGSLEQLRRGTWAKDGRDAWTLEAAEQHGLSRAHATIARILYADGSEGSLLYVKPTLIGDEPLDLRQYHRDHPSFPHEPTRDQFFDEAQWESYRRLGELIGERLLQDEGVLQKFLDGRAHEKPSAGSGPVPKRADFQVAAARAADPAER